MMNSVINAVDGLNNLVIFRANTLVAISSNTLQELGHYDYIDNTGWMASSFDKKYLFQFQYDELRTLDINTLQFFPIIFPNILNP